MPRFLNNARVLACTVLGVLLAVLLLEYTGFDLWLQDHFFNFSTGQWIVPANAPVPRFWFYNFPKVLLIIYGVALLWFVVAPVSWRKDFFPERRTALYLLLSLGVTPLVIGGGKTLSYVYCPSEIQRYGGHAEYRRVFDRLARGNHGKERGHCFPAGHASGGFALLSLYHVARTRRERLIALAFPFAVGGTMGIYQMFKGAHYLSHTVVTLIIAWGITTMLANKMRVRSR